MKDDDDLYRRFVRACNAMNDRGELPEGWDADNEAEGVPIIGREQVIGG